MSLEDNNNPTHEYMGVTDMRESDITESKIRDIKTKKVEKIKEEKLRLDTECKVKRLSNVKYESRKLLYKIHKQSDNDIVKEYYRACAILGKDPLIIECQDGKYVVTDIPDNYRDLTIPRFVEKVDIKDKHLTDRLVDKAQINYIEKSKSNEIKFISERDAAICNYINTLLEDKLQGIVDKINDMNRDQACRSSLYEVQNMFNNPTTDNTEIYDRLNDLTTKFNISCNSLKQVDRNSVTQEKLKEILEEVKGLYNKSEESERQLATQLSYINNTMQSISQEINNIGLSDEVLDKYKDIEAEINKNSRELLEFKGSIASKFKHLETKLEEELKKSNVEEDDIKKCMDSTSYYSTDNIDKIRTSDTEYNNIMQTNSHSIGIKHKDVEKIWNLLSETYNAYKVMERTINNLDPVDMDNLKKSQSLSYRLSSVMKNVKNKPVESFSTAMEDGTELIANGAAKVEEGVLQWIPEKIKSQFEDRRKKRQNTSKGLEKLCEQYSISNVIEEFYENSDRDIAVYLLEDKYKDKELESVQNFQEYYQELEYRWLFKTFNIRNYTDKEKELIALAFICTRKIIRGSKDVYGQNKIDINVHISPKVSIEYLSQIPKLEGYTEVFNRNRRLYFSIMLEIIRTNLVVLGFRIDYIDNQIIKVVKVAIKECIGQEVYKLRSTDIENMSFDIDDYK